MKFYVHGAGLAGREAWPAQSGDGVFVDHSGAATMSGKVAVVVQQAPDAPVVIVAHSLGAVPVALAYQAGELAATQVVLLEPALYDVARGHEAIEAHIGPMTTARERAAAGDLFGYWDRGAPDVPPPGHCGDLG